MGVTGIVELQEPQGGVGLVEVGRAGVDEGHRLAVHRPPGVHDPVHRSVSGQRLRARRAHVVGVGGPGVGLAQLVHRPALSLVEVVEGIAAAQHLGEGVGVIRCGRGRAPRIVITVAQLHI